MKMNNPLTKEQLDQVPQIAYDIWEVAFGEDAFQKGYTDEEVLSKLMEFSHKAFAWDTMWEEHQPNDEDEDTQEDYDLREKMETYLRSCEDE
jgi:hypothetical protein